jgi:hypothetical protein
MSGGPFEDMRAFHRERSPIKRDEIAARMLHALREYRRPRKPTAARRLAVNWPLTNFSAALKTTTLRVRLSVHAENPRID